jgi:riboflavin synthase
VDGTGWVKARRFSGDSLFLTVGLNANLARFLLPKGSVAVDGVSLTVDRGPFRDGFSVNVVPHTLSHTQLGQLKLGQLVNLEMDVLVKAARGEGLPVTLQAAAGEAETKKKVQARALRMTDLFAAGFGGKKRS